MCMTFSFSGGIVSLPSLLPHMSFPRITGEGTPVSRPSSIELNDIEAHTSNGVDRNGKGNLSSPMLGINVAYVVF